MLHEYYRDARRNDESKRHAIQRSAMKDKNIQRITKSAEVNFTHLMILTAWFIN